MPVRVSLPLLPASWIALALAGAQDPALDIAFEPPERYALGHTSEPIALGDLDGDAHLDLVVANTGADGQPGGDTVSVLLGDASGSFRRGGDFAAGDRPEGIALGHFDGGETLDVAAADLTGSAVAVLPGDGAGGFGEPILTPVPGGPRSLVAHDWNSDGITDLATANYDGDSVSILLGTGTGGFLTLDTVAVGNGPEVVAIAQLTADSAPDLVTSDALGNTVTPLINDGTGHFTAGAGYTVGLNPRYLAALDLDSDGLDELVVANNDSHTVTIERNLGGGVFSNARTLEYATPGLTFREPVFLAIADVTGEGFADVLATWARSNVFTIFPRTAAGLDFGSPSAHETGDTPVGIAAADFDGDGGVDVAVSNALEDSCFVYRSYRSNPGVILDDGEAGTEAVGSWVSSAAPFAFGASSLFSKGGTRYVWAAALSEPGIYDAMAWWTVTSSRSTAVPIEVRHADGNSAMLVSQRSGIGLWHSLGTYAFGGTGTVVLTSPQGDESASADAVRFRPRKDLSSAPRRGTVVVEVATAPGVLETEAKDVLLAFHGTLAARDETELQLWTAATFAPVGEGEESANIAAVRLHVDSNGDRTLDPQDRQVGATLQFGSDIRVVTFQGFTELLPQGTPADFFVACELLPGATGAFQLELSQLAARGAATSTLATLTGLPARGWVFPRPQAVQRPGDGNQDGRLDISDAVHLLNFLFQGTVARLPCGDGSPEWPGNIQLLDSNGDLKTDLSDAIRVLGFLFDGAPPPPLGRDCLPVAGCPDNAAKCGG